MNKIEKLLKELCPNGVEYKKIGDICNISRGIVMSKDFIRENEGEYPVYSSQTENNGELGKINTYKYDGKYLTWTTDGANAGTVFYREGKFSVTNVCGLLEVKENNIDIKYLYHILSKTAPEYVSKGMGNAKLMSNVMASIEIPIPPLEIQKEIVNILDKMVFLERELEKRKTQYEYYRSLLLTPKEKSLQHIPLKDLANFTYGYTDTAKDEGDTRFIRITDINNDGNLEQNSPKYITLNEDAKKYLLKKGDLLLARTGATFGKTLYVPNDEQAVYASFLIKIDLNNELILNRYYWHFTKSQLYWEQANKYVTKAGQPQFNTGAVSKIIVPVPSLEIQQKIVDVLDNFEKYCSDLNIGLPAEIEARRKQYEYYRNKLLSFNLDVSDVPETLAGGGGL